MFFDPDFIKGKELFKFFDRESSNIFKMIDRLALNAGLSPIFEGILNKHMTLFVLGKVR